MLQSRPILRLPKAATGLDFVELLPQVCQKTDLLNRDQYEILFELIDRQIQRRLPANREYWNKTLFKLFIAVLVDSFENQGDRAFDQHSISQSARKPDVGITYFNYSKLAVTYFRPNIFRFRIEQQVYPCPNVRVHMHCPNQMEGTVGRASKSFLPLLTQLAILVRAQTIAATHAPLCQGVSLKDFKSFLEMVLHNLIYPIQSNLSNLYSLI